MTNQDDALFDSLDRTDPSEEPGAVDGPPTDSQFAFCPTTHRVAWAYEHGRTGYARVWLRLVDEGIGRLSIEEVEPSTEKRGAIWWEVDQCGLGEALGYRSYGGDLEREMRAAGVSPGQVFCVEGSAYYSGHGEETEYEATFSVVDKEPRTEEQHAAAWALFAADSMRWEAYRKLLDETLASEARLHPEHMCVIWDQTGEHHGLECEYWTPTGYWIRLSSVPIQIRVRGEEDVVTHQPGCAQPVTIAGVSEKGDTLPWAALAVEIERKEPEVARRLCEHVKTATLEAALIELPRYCATGWGPRPESVVLDKEIIY